MVDIEGIILDLDGTIYRGESLLPFAAEFVSKAKEKGIKILFLTNNSQRTTLYYTKKLQNMGINVTQEEILTSAKATAIYIKEHYELPWVFPIGEDGLLTELIARGIPITYDWKTASILVVGYDTNITYKKLKDAALLLANGGIFIACNPDRSLPTEEGNIPGNGAQIAFLKESTGREPYIIGKPHMPIVKEALSILNIPAEKTLIIGDRYETDILTGFRANLRTALVLTGATKEKDLTGRRKPDFVARDLEDLWRKLSI